MNPLMVERWAQSMVDVFDCRRSFVGSVRIFCGFEITDLGLDQPAYSLIVFDSAGCEDIALVYGLYASDIKYHIR
jgi:hypothetical protein